MFDRDRGFPIVDIERTRADRGPTPRASSLPAMNANKWIHVSNPKQLIKGCLVNSFSEAKSVTKQDVVIRVFQDKQFCQIWQIYNWNSNLLFFVGIK